MRKLLLASTILIASATLAQAADINRVEALCSKRGTCVELVSVDLLPALLIEGGTSLTQRNPDPFHQFTPQPPIQVQQPVPGQPSQVVVQAPAPAPPQRDLWDWIMVGLGGILTALFGTNVLQGFRKPNLNDPNALRIMALQAAQIGLKSPVVDNLLNFPGEDIVERIANSVIERRLASLGFTQQPGIPGPGVGSGMVAVPADKMTGLLDGVEALIKRFSQGQQPPNVQQPRT